MNVKYGAALKHLANSTANAYWLDLKVTTLTVDSGGSIQLDGLGYTAGNGTGTGASAGGGGHGGAGGAGNPGAGGGTNDSDMDPVLPGSGAGTTATGGAGGGSLKITSTGTVTINGNLTVNGANGASSGGGGAGGSVNITARVFTGGGLLFAKGGNGTASGGGGGGGRVAVSTNDVSGYVNWYGNSLCDGAAVSGGSGYSAGSAGTQRLNGSATCESSAPGAVTDLFASSGAVGATIKLDWTAKGNNGASGTIWYGGYKIQYSTSSTVFFSTANAQVTFSTQTVNPGDRQFYTLYGLTGNASYYIRVWTADEVANWSAVSNGATAYALVASPALNTPTSATWINTSSPAFSWSQVNTTGTLNYWDLSTASNFSTIFHTTATLSASFTSTVTLTNSTVYYWRVRSWGNQGIYSPSWSTSSFTTDLVQPAASSFRSYSSTNGAMSETQFNDLLSGVTAQITVQDVLSGMLVSTVPAGLVGQWHFDEGGGATAFDASANSYDGGLFNNPAWTPGRLGRALNFNGSNSYVLVPNSSGLSITNNLTLEAWINPTVSGNSNHRAILSKRPASGSASYQLYLNNAAGANQGRLSFWNGTEYISPYIPPVGVWTHVAATVNGTLLTLYANGAWVFSATIGALPVTSGSLGIGRTGDYIGTEYFNGYIDEVRIYNLTRSAEQINADYESDTLSAHYQGQAFNVLYSSNAGSAWTYISADDITMTGSNGDTAAQTFKALGLNLASSTNTQTCNGAIPCGATNQVKFYASDLAGNVKTAGPYAILVNLPIPTPVNVIPQRSTQTWYNISTFTFTSNFSSAAYYRYTWDTSPAHTWTFAETQWLASANTLNMTATSDSNSWYLHLLAYNVANSSGTDRHIGPFYFDASSPTASSFRSYSSTNGAIFEMQFNDLLSGVTAQITVQDVMSGMQYSPVDSGTGLWHLDNNWADSSANGNTLTGGAAAAFTTDSKSGTHAANFSGAANSYAYKASPTGLPTGGAATVTAWIKPLSGQGDASYNGIVVWGPRSSANTFALAIQSSGRPSFASWGHICPVKIEGNPS